MASIRIFAPCPYCSSAFAQPAANGGIDDLAGGPGFLIDFNSLVGKMKCAAPFNPSSAAKAYCRNMCMIVKHKRVNLGHRRNARFIARYLTNGRAQMPHGGRFKRNERGLEPWMAKDDVI